MPASSHAGLSSGPFVGTKPRWLLRGHRRVLNALIRAQSAWVTRSVTLSQCLASGGLRSLLTYGGDGESGARVIESVPFLRSAAPGSQSQTWLGSESLRTGLGGWLVCFPSGAESLAVGPGNICVPSPSRNSDEWPGRIAASPGLLCTQRTFRNCG